MVKQRSVALGIILSLITCGIYSWYWIVCIADDFNALFKKNDMSSGVVLLLGLLTCGLFWVYWYYKTGDELGRMDNSGGSLGIICLVLQLLNIFTLPLTFGLLGFIALALLQNKLNDFASQQNNPNKIEAPYHPVGE